MTRAREGRREKKRRKVPVSQKERAMGILNEMFVHTFGLRWCPVGVWTGSRGLVMHLPAMHAPTVTVIVL